MMHEEGSVDYAVNRLRVWLDRGPRMARIEYASEYARHAVIEQLRTMVLVNEVTLEPAANATRIADRMVEALRQAARAEERTIVSFTALDRALPQPVPQALNAVNFQRESFADAGTGQIWWLPRHFLTEFVRFAPDLDSWFDIKLSIMETPRPARSGLGMIWEDSEVLPPEEARQRARSLLDRAEKAMRSGEPWLPVWRELVHPALAMLRSGTLRKEADQEARRLVQLAKDLQGAIAQPETLEGWDELAAIQGNMGDLVSARYSAEKALALAEKFEGSDSPAAAERAKNLGLILVDLHEFTAAALVAERALRIDEQVFGSRHPKVARDANNLGMILRGLGDLPAARNLTERALRLAEEVYGPNHPSVATAAHNLGQILEDLGDLPAARTLTDRALRILTHHFGPDHPRTRVAAGNLRGIEVAMNL